MTTKTETQIIIELIGNDKGGKIIKDALVSIEKQAKGTEGRFLLGRPEVPPCVWDEKFSRRFWGWHGRRGLAPVINDFADAGKKAMSCHPEKCNKKLPNAIEDDGDDGSDCHGEPDVSPDVKFVCYGNLWGSESCFAWMSSIPFMAE